jgi:hypothetical protein
MDAPKELSEINLRISLVFFPTAHEKFTANLRAYRFRRHS